MKPQDAKDASVEGETAMGTWEKWSKAQSPTMKPLAASHLQLTHPNQPTQRKEQNVKRKKELNKEDLGRSNMVLTMNSVTHLERNMVKTKENILRACWFLKKIKN